MSDVPDARRRILELPQKRLALLALQLQDELARERDARHEPIAVVGMGCRYPGGVDSPDEYWRLLQGGRDAIVEVPEDRWSIEELYDPDPDAPGRIATRWGGFLDDVQRFDAAFFSISPREARAMDPQQRLVLEVAWRAFEDAGIPPARYRDRLAGVFVGLCNNDYLTRLLKEGPHAIDAYLSSGSAYSVVSGRVSFTFGFRGPALTCDTACSSSLVALHEAVHSLRSGESEMAVAAGVNVMCSPETSMALSRARMMAPDGRCKTFDDAADGFVRAEGCGVLVLKRLSDARRDGDRIHALIRGSALGQDGRSTGLTVPNGPAQVEVVRAALADARLEPDEIDYIEAHGTGTSLGDPIEIQALGRVFGTARPRPLRVGSVKTNLGHLESAAGIAGVMKAILSVREGAIPPHLHLERRSTRIEWSSYDIEVPSDGMAWPETGAPRRAGVSSFGFSGTNAHAIVEQAPPSVDRVPESDGQALPLHLLPISGFTPDARETISGEYGAAVEGLCAESFRDFCHTARAGRSEFGWRRAVVAADPAEVRAALAGELDAPRVIEGPRKVAAPPEVAFVFTGQGAQHPGMGRALYDHVVPFRDAIDRCAELLDGILPIPLLDALFEGEGDDAPIYRTTIAQPAVVAFEWALAQMWQAWGVRPAAVVGHSLGEFAAACVAGTMSLEDTLRLVAERGRLLDSLPGGDRMAAVFTTEEAVDEVLAGIDGEVMIGAMNSPMSTVISGAAGPVDAAVAAFTERGIEVRTLKLDKGFHSSRVEPVLDSLEAYAEGITYHPPSIPLARNVEGEIGAIPPSARYWREHARRPVRFTQCVRAVAKLGIGHFLEVGPHPALSPMVAQTLDDEGSVTVPSLRRDGDPARDVLEAAAELWAEGVPVDLGATGVGRRVSIPGHPLEGDRYWVDPPRAGAAAVAPKGEVPGIRLSSAIPIHEMRFAPDAPAFLAEHRFEGVAVLPGPLYVEAALEAARREGWVPRGVVDLDLRAPARVESVGLRLQTILEEEAGSIRFRVLSSPDGNGGAGAEERWLEHARGTLVVEPGTPGDAPEIPIGSGTTEPVDRAAHLSRLRSLGFELGPTAARWTELRCGDGVASARIAPASANDEATGPVGRALLLDAAAQVLGAAVAGPGPIEARMLAGIDEVVWTGPAEAAVQCRAAVRRGEPAGRVVGDALLLDADDGVVAWLRGARLGTVSAPAGERDRLHHRLEWRSTPLSDRVAAPFAGSAPEAARSRVIEAWEELATSAGLPAYVSALPELRARAAEYAASALATLGLDGAVGSPVPDDLADTLGVHARHRRLLPRLLEILGETGYLSGSPDEGYRVLRALPTSPPTAIPTEDPVRALLDRCGAHLTTVLTGERDPLELLFPRGSRDTTRSVYRDTGFGRTFNRALGRAVAALGESVSGERPLRVLEVGAGSGSTTVEVLSALAGRSLRYVFTDVGASLVAEARSEFGERAGMEFRTFDLESDPTAQGLDRGEFDLVVAANVVHATARLDRSLGHLRDLLAPGGVLVLLEGTRPEPWVDLTFGLTEGWWRFSDAEVRDSHPLPSLQGWMDALGRAGFESIGAAPFETEIDAAGQAVILARAATMPAVRPLPPKGELAAALAEAGARPHDGGEWILDARELGPTDLISAVRAVLDETDGGRLRIVTAGAQPVPGDDADAIDPDQAALWGLARCFALEHPDRWGGILDVARTSSSSEVARQVVREIEGGGVEDQVVRRGEARLLPRLVSFVPEATGSSDLRAGSYLVTGGLGGLGPVVAEWLAARGATHLVLVGRTASPDHLDPAAREMVDRLEAAGVRVTIRAVDVTDREALTRLVDDLRAGAEPLRGVVHAAAVFDSAPVVDATAAHLHAVLGPKVSGARNLLRAVESDDLDFILFFSSTTSILGVAELGAYAAANQVLDALAARARSEGVPVTAIGWGIWDEMRLAGDEERERYARVGLRPMRSGAALDALGRVLSGDGAHTVLADVDWTRLRDVYESRRVRPLLAELGRREMSEVGLGEGGGAAAGASGEPEVRRADLHALDPEDRLERIAGAVEAEVRAVLRLSDDHPVDTGLGFFEMGMDSLMSVELRGRLERALGMRLPSTLAFNYPTIAEASEFISGRITAAAPETPKPHEHADTVEAEVERNAGHADDRPSEEELGRRLAERLAQLERLEGGR
jgi:acyl transferase domain-containing protein/acyl carrier protein